MVVFYVPIGLSVVTPPSLVYVGVATSNNTSTSSVTFSGVSFGTPRSDRILIIGAGTGSDNIASLVIGGVTGTLASGSKATNPSPFAYCSGIYSVAMPTGTSGNVVLTASGTTSTANNPSIEVYAAYGLISATSFDGDSAVNGTINSVSLNVPASGLVVAYGRANATVGTVVWTGVNKDNQQIYNALVSSASLGPTTTALSPLNASAAGSGGLASAPNVSIASFR